MKHCNFCNSDYDIVSLIKAKMLRLFSNFKNNWFCGLCTSHLPDLSDPTKYDFSNMWFLLTERQTDLFTWRCDERFAHLTISNALWMSYKNADRLSLFVISDSLLHWAIWNDLVFTSGVLLDSSKKTKTFVMCKYLSVPGVWPSGDFWKIEYTGSNPVG